MVAFSGLGMAAITVEEFLQSLLVFGAALLMDVIDALVDVFDILGLVDDLECGELVVVEGDNVEVALTVAFEQLLVALDEDAGEVPDVVVLRVLTDFETGVLEKIFIEDVLVDQGSLDFGLVGDVEGF